MFLSGQAAIIGSCCFFFNGKNRVAAHAAKDHRTRAIAILDGKFSGDTKSDTVDKCTEK